jgi:hypothetical protein
MENGNTTQTQALKGDKFHIISTLEELEGQVKKSNP